MSKPAYDSKTVTNLCILDSLIGGWDTEQTTKSPFLSRDQSIILGRNSEAGEHSSIYLQSVAGDPAGKCQ